MNFRNITLIITLAFGFISCQKDVAKEEAAVTRNPISVTTKKSGIEMDGATSVLSGTVQAKEEAIVSARMMGYAKDIRANVGEKVVADQVLIRIENNEMPAKRAQAAAGVLEAEAALKNVEVNYERIKTLWEQESVTLREWDDISAQYEMTKAKVEGARQMKREIDEVVGLMAVKSPISGILSSKAINKGDLVNPGVPLMTVVGNKGYEIITYVSDHQINAIHSGLELHCSIDALNKRFTAEVTEVSPSAVNTGGQFAIKAKLNLSTEDLKTIYPGMYVNVMVPLSSTSTKSNIATVEKSAIIERGQLKGVYTISNQNTALLRWIRTGRDFGNQLEVVSGLEYGEEYIVGNHSTVRDGLPVSK